MKQHEEAVYAAAQTNTCLLPQWNNPKSCTFAAATDRITVALHGLSAGNRVRFSSTDGGVTKDTIYYIESVIDENTIKITATPGGAAVDLSALTGAQTIAPAAIGALRLTRVIVTNQTTAGYVDLLDGASGRRICPRIYCAINMPPAVIPFDRFLLKGVGLYVTSNTVTTHSVAVYYENE